MLSISHFDGEDLQYEIDVNIELDAPEGMHQTVP